MYCSYITTAWETEPSYFFCPFFYAIPVISPQFFIIRFYVIFSILPCRNLRYSTAFLQFHYCYECGYDWNGLYKQFRRVSCWCCPLQSLDELRELYRHHTELWEQLKTWDKRTWRSFRADYSVEELEKRFDFEDEWQKAGKPLRSRAFFSALKRRLERK